MYEIAVGGPIPRQIAIQGVWIVWGGVYIESPPTIHMAKKRTLFKTVSNVHVESIANATWSSILRLDKMQDSFNSAYVEKVRISFVSGEDDSDENQAWLFCSSLDDTMSATAANNDGQVISASATSGAGGVVTLPVKRSVRSNETPSGTSEAGNPIYIHIRAAATGAEQKAYMIIETWGRFHKATAL